MRYKNELSKSMEYLCNDKDFMIVGQSTCGGTFMTSTLLNVDKDKLLEFPICEQFNCQFAFGLALAGQPTLAIIPRLNFLLLGISDIVNTFDKFHLIAKDKIKPNLIIRSAVGPDFPVHPRFQHVGNYTEALCSMLTNIKVHYLGKTEDIFSSYKEASEGGIHLIIEEGNYYNKEV